MKKTCLASQVLPFAPLLAPGPPCAPANQIAHPTSAAVIARHHLATSQPTRARLASCRRHSRPRHMPECWCQGLPTRQYPLNYQWQKEGAATTQLSPSRCRRRIYRAVFLPEKSKDRSTAKRRAAHNRLQPAGRSSTVVVSNSAGSVTSNTATLTVNLAHWIRLPERRQLSKCGHYILSTSGRRKFARSTKMRDASLSIRRTYVGFNSHL